MGYRGKFLKMANKNSQHHRFVKLSVPISVVAILFMSLTIISIVSFLLRVRLSDPLTTVALVMVALFSIIFLLSNAFGYRKYHRMYLAAVAAVSILTTIILTILMWGILQITCKSIVPLLGA